MKLEKLKKIFFIFLVIGLLAVPIFSSLAEESKTDSEKAGDSNYGLPGAAEEAYGVSKIDQLRTDPVEVIGLMVGVVLSLLGVIFLVQIIIAGISWMTAGGSEEKITKAKDNLLHSTIGLLIVVAAYVIGRYALDIALKVIKAK